MAAKGPIPKRSEEKLSPRRPEQQALVTDGTLRPVSWPRVDNKWHRFAKDWYTGLQKSGQADYYQQSDIAFARFIADQMTYYQESKSRSSMMLTAIMQGMNSLLTTVGDRQRASIELQRPQEAEEDAQVLMIADYRSALAKPAEAV